MEQQLSIVSAKHQRDWDNHLPLVLMAYRSTVHDSTSCNPVLLMLGREIRTHPYWHLADPDSPSVPPGPEYARRLQDRLETAHSFARRQLLNAGDRSVTMMFTPGAGTLRLAPLPPNTRPQSPVASTWPHWQRRPSGRYQDFVCSLRDKKL
ncbi:hypothetical protein SKAU_G00411360 [Synaphobranchus kaupii]|uniref:Uncharacterized protein n=1 Tax=Synaphobranchus kaupii TaxID=118154 RepID=A0A9Q1E7X6_SYNKA|nr:hypothetical protein SKAU_G00411360 [Synaphobranchus kaupii]